MKGLRKQASYEDLLSNLLEDVLQRNKRRKGKAWIWERDGSWQTAQKSCRMAAGPQAQRAASAAFRGKAEDPHSIVANQGRRCPAMNFHQQNTQASEAQACPAKGGMAKRYPHFAPA